jgi:hypothetical protein
MSKKWIQVGACLATLAAAPGCCSWCERCCPYPMTYAPASQPVCCPQPAYGPPGPVPAGYQPNWSNPQPAYNLQNPCCP